MPLVEAFVELKWRLTPTPSGGHVDPAYPFYVGGVRQLIKAEYPFQEKLPMADFPDEMTPHVVKYRFRPSAEAWPVVQIGAGIASYNAVGDYEWSRFEAGAVKYFDALNEAYSSVADTARPDYIQFLLRYINAVDLPVGTDPLQFLADKLGTTVTLPEAIVSTAPDAASVLTLTIGFPLASPGVVGALAFAMGEREGKSALIWETTVNANVERDSSATADFSNWLSYSHTVAENWFFTLIAGDLEEQFR